MHISAQTKYQVELAEEEKTTIKQIIKKGESKARTITRARILQLADAGKKDADICFALGIVRSVVYDTRKHYQQSGIDRALYDLPHKGAARKLTGEQEAEVIAIACSKAPKGYVRWTLNLLTAEVNNKIGVTIGRTAIWKVLLRNDTKPWLKKNVVHRESNRRIQAEHAGRSGSI